MGMKSRKSIVRFLYTLCVWMTVSIACLWVINGDNPRLTSTSFKEQTSTMVEIGVRKRNVYSNRSVSKHLSATHSNFQQLTTTTRNTLTKQTLKDGVDMGDSRRMVEYRRFLSTHLSVVEDSRQNMTQLNVSDHNVEIDNVKLSDNKSIDDSQFYDVTGNSYLNEDGQTNQKTVLDFDYIKSRGPFIAAKNVTESELPDVQSRNKHSDKLRDNDKSDRERRLPQVLIIGVKKCGTRALLEYLRLHPDIRAPGPEPHFFDRYYHLGLDWYREKMPYSSQGQLTIEKTPRYFVNSEIPERVHRMSRDIKLIIVVRDPVTRAISDFTQSASRQRYIGKMAFERKAFKCNGTGQVNMHWSGISTGIYVTHVKRWLQFFPFANMHFVSGENLIRSPALELESIQGFLNLTRFINEDHFYFNETKGFPCVRKDKTPRNFQCFNSRKGRPHIKVQDESIRRLRTFFEPYNKQFYQLTGINFGW